jgi:hypothetical protein
MFYRINAIIGRSCDRIIEVLLYLTPPITSSDVVLDSNALGPGTVTGDILKNVFEENPKYLRWILHQL